MCWVSWVVLVASICFSHLLADKVHPGEGQESVLKKICVDPDC